MHAGHIIQISVLDKHSNKKKVIYKEFADDRNNEIDVYSKILPALESFVPVIDMWETPPHAILMNDLDRSVKNSFEHLPIESKKVTLLNILSTMAEIHTNKNIDVHSLKLEKHTITSEWYEWCLDQLNRLHALSLDWYNPSWLTVIEEIHKSFYLKRYEPRGPLVLTHGDPHLDNIFIDHDGSVLLIDWEWAALGSPLRDVTILMQDVYDADLINFIKVHYPKQLMEKGLTFEDKNYINDFDYLYVDHTLMMLAWEIEKFFNGYVSEDKIKDIVTFKINQLKMILRR